MKRLVTIAVFFELTVLIVGVTWIGPFARDDAPEAGAVAAPASEETEFRLESDGSGEIVSVELVAEETTQTLADGVDYQVWTFNGTSPGPVIRVNLGDTIRFTLTNNSSHNLAHSIDFHAAQTPWDQNYQPVAPGETLTFDWVARFPGVFMYHCGAPPVLHHISNGMYGAIIVEPDDLTPAREYVLTSSEFYLGDEPDRAGVFAGDVAKMESADPTYVVFDGMADRYLDAPLQARPDELIRIWVLNAGPTLTTAFHVIGALFDHVYADGNLTSVLNGLQTYNVAPGAGAMFELRIPDEGLYPFVTHSFAYTGLGSVGVLQVTADAPPAPKDYPAFGDPFSGGVLEFGATPGVVSPSEEGGGQEHEGPVVVEAAISGFDPSDLEVPEGEVGIQLVNLDAFDHDFTVDELDVKLLMGPNETVDETFQATPGTYTFYCSIPGHREAGMEGTITVLPGAGH